jgi:hypothetical protein
MFYTLFSQVHPSILPTKKICKDCKHFIEYKIECRKFGVTDLVTGEVTYNSAIKAREDENKCGEDAIHFEENHFKITTVPYYFLKKNLDQILLILLLPAVYLSLYYAFLFQIIK